MKKTFLEFMSEQTPIMTFEEFVAMREAPIAFDGNYGSDYIPVTYMSTSGLKATKYETVKNVDSYENTKDYAILVSTYNGNAVIGEYVKEPKSGEDSFAVYCKLSFGKYSKLESDKDNTLKVRLVTTSTDKRLERVAYTLYKSLILGGYTIVSDNEQYQGAVALWKKLMKDSGVKVTFYDEKESKSYDKLPDEEIWSKDPDDSKYDMVIVAQKA
jgi:hypothetical protein